MLARPHVAMSQEEIGWTVLTPSATRLLAHLDGTVTVLQLIEARHVPPEQFFDALDELARCSRRR